MKKLFVILTYALINVSVSRAQEHAEAVKITDARTLTDDPKNPKDLRIPIIKMFYKHYNSQLLEYAKRDFSSYFYEHFV